MDVEARLLLYTVALGAAIGLIHLFVRRAYAFRVYAAELAVLLALSAAALAVKSWTAPLAWPAFWGFVVVAIAPSALIEAARRAAKSRRFDLAWMASTTGAVLLGAPAPLRREAAMYGALSAAERGDDALCRRRLDRVARVVGIPAELGGDALVHVLPATARRAWDEVLAALDAVPFRPPTLLAVEVRAAADTGDIRRALRACRDIDAFGAAAGSTRSSARRCLLAAAGRAAFLEEAASSRLSVVAGPPGTVDLAIARAREALGDVSGGATAYAAAARAGRGGLRLDAAAGERRCAEGRPLLATTDEPETAALLDLEAVCRAEGRAPESLGIVRRAPFTLGASLVTTIVSVLVLAFLGLDGVSLLSAGALSAPLIVHEHEWWRLGTAMLLHAGWFHLGMNVASIVFIGAPLETRLGPARVAIVYLGSGFLASAASAYWQHTDVGVGASGAAMGLIGALGVLLLARPALFDPAERRRWLGALGITVIATLVVGLAESEYVDNTAHGAGLVAGAALGWLLLPRALESRRHGAFRRLGAALLCGLMLDCVWATAARMGDWRGERVVQAPGVAASIPTWLRLRATPDAGLVASRSPLHFAVQLGASPSQPRPTALVPDDEKTGRAFTAMLARGPTRTDPDRLENGLLSQSADYLDGEKEGFRLRTFRRGSAFAVVLVPLDPDGETEGDDVAVRIGRSLAPVE